MSAGCPAKCTGMMAFVRGVIARLDTRRVEVERVEVDVHEHRDAVGLDHGGGRGEERVGRDDDFVLGLQARGHQRDAQRDRAVDHGDAVPAAVHRGEALLELGDLVAGEASPLAAAERGEHSRLVGLVEDRPAPGSGRERTGVPPSSASVDAMCQSLVSSDAGRSGGPADSNDSRRPM